MDGERSPDDQFPDVALMIEGQNGLTWSRLRRVAAIAAESPFTGLFRSDHFTNPEGPVTDSLGLWPSLTWLADNTESIEFGSLVSPVSFRHPVHTARMARDVDDLSGGRLVLGLGAGWQEREHETFGFDLLSPNERFDRFEEGLSVVTRLLREEDVDVDGEYFELDGATLRPRPDRPGGPTILVGGNGMHRTLPLAARYADEYNAVFLPVEGFERRMDRLDDLLAERDRDRESVRRSMMTRVVYGRDEAAIQAATGDDDPEELREAGAIVGTADEIRDDLARLGEAGADRVMLQWLDLGDLDRLEEFAETVPPTGDQ